MHFPLNLSLFAGIVRGFSAQRISSVKRVWVKADPSDNEMVLAALKGGADALLLPEGGSSHVKRRG